MYISCALSDSNLNFFGNPIHPTSNWSLVWCYHQKPSAFFKPAKSPKQDNINRLIKQITTTDNVTISSYNWTLYQSQHLQSSICHLFLVIQFLLSFHFTLQWPLEIWLTLKTLNRANLYSDSCFVSPPTSTLTTLPPFPPCFSFDGLLYQALNWMEKCCNYYDLRSKLHHFFPFNSGLCNAISRISCIHDSLEKQSNLRC